ncbi:MAG: hypothetical protein IKL21_06450, partial [Clostridia bacterium]|nr:hypothetical protein [Clostridia bacterium]
KAEVCKTFIPQFKSGWRLQKEKHFVRSAFLFGNDVCLRQMMLALPMMTAAPNDVCLTAH